jgi:hypothetical protein
LPAKWENITGSFMHGPEDGEKEEMLTALRSQRVRKYIGT